MKTLSLMHLCITTVIHNLISSNHKWSILLNRKPEGSHFENRGQRYQHVNECSVYQLLVVYELCVGVFHGLFIHFHRLHSYFTVYEHLSRETNKRHVYSRQKKHIALPFLGIIFCGLEGLNILFV